MWRRLPILSLVRRIIVSVTVCLTLILALHLLVALWTIDESTQAAFHERVALARVLAGRVGEVLTHELAALQTEAASVTIAPGGRLTQDEERRLSGLNHLLSDFARISVTGADGTVLWTTPTETPAETLPAVDPESLRAVLTTGQPVVTRVALGRLTLARLLVPLAGLDGLPAGVLVTELDPAGSDLALLPTRGIDQGVVAQLMDADGRLLVGAGIPGPQGALTSTPS